MVSEWIYQNQGDLLWLTLILGNSSRYQTYTESKRSYDRNEEVDIPWYRTCERLPSIFLILSIRSAILLTIELWIYEGARRRIIERIRRVIDPFATKPVTSSCKFSLITSTGNGSCCCCIGVKFKSFCLVWRKQKK